MKTSITVSFVFLLLFPIISFSQVRFNHRLELGSAESVLNGIISQNTLTPSEYSFKTCFGELINVDVENYYFKEGRLAMNGKARGTENSVFIMKGNKTSLYGYVAIHDTKVAYEYTTNGNGQVVVEEVPISKIVSDLYDIPEPPAQNAPTNMAPIKYSPMALGQVIHIGKYNNQDVTKLESKPGSRYVYYMDISAVMTGDVPKNSVSKEEMYINWQCTADQFSMYDLNVTTSRSVYTAAGVPNSGIAGFLNQDGRSNADLNSFGTAKASRLYRNITSSAYGYGQGRTTAHEGGHQMGLNHDGGQPGGEYYEGIPAFQWCPIMGNFWFGNAWDHALYQWSKGEYSGANNKEADLVVIQQNFPFAADDIPTTKALKIGSTGVVDPKENFGQVNANTDTDVFTFEITGSNGHITLKLDPIEFIRMLDIDARIVNASGTTIVQSNLAVNRSASFDVDLPTGAYKLEIKGGAEGTPQNGFSTYSSMGFYAMEGTVTGSAVGILSNDFSSFGLEAFPNPSCDVVRLTFNGIVNDSYTLEIKNTLGQVVYGENLTNYTGKYSHDVDLKKYGSGMYFVSLTNSKEQSIKRIVIQ